MTTITDTFAPITQQEKMALIGMSTHWEKCEGLDTFEHHLFKGTQLFTSEGQKDVNNPTLLNGTPNPKALLLQTAQAALADANISETKDKTAILLIPIDQTQLEADSIEEQIQYLLKNLPVNGTKVSLTYQKAPTSAALQTAQRLLSSHAIRQVLICESRSFDSEDNLKQDKKVGATAILLKRVDAIHSSQKIYALIDAFTTVKTFSETDSIPALQSQHSKSCCLQTLNSLSLNPDQIGYLEFSGWQGNQETSLNEIKGSVEAYTTKQNTQLTCAIGSINTTIKPSTNNITGLMGLVKTALCLYHRYFPASQNLALPELPLLWQKSPFFRAEDSAPWFTTPQTPLRRAAVNLVEDNNCFTHVILSESTAHVPETYKMLQREPLYLFPLAAQEQTELLDQLITLQNTLSHTQPGEAARACYKNYQQTTNPAFSAVILGYTTSELLHEIELAIKGITKAIETQTEWQTPAGSYFTPTPLGKSAKITFVYPGAFNSYIGIGQELFHLFPDLYKAFSNITSDIGTVLKEKLLYPRSLNTLDKEQKKAIENQLNSDLIAMLTSGTGLSFLYTHILQNIFAVHSQAAFGYSLGENSMMFATGAWTNGDEATEKLIKSPLFHTRLSGPQNAVREYWNLPTKPDDFKEENFWSSYVIMASPEAVKEAIKSQDQVYITLINSPRQVVIAGKEEACLQTIKKLGKTMYLRAPYDYAIHCDPIKSEFQELAYLHNWPIQKQPAFPLYFAADCAQSEMEQNTIAKKIATGLCNCLDFPRLVNTVYDDGADIFIELGAGSNCTKWIDSILKGKPHAAMSINRQGANDFSSILRVLARLIGHNIPLDLSILYCDNIKTNSEILNTHVPNLEKNNANQNELQRRSLPV